MTTFTNSYGVRIKTYLWGWFWVAESVQHNRAFRVTVDLPWFQFTKNITKPGRKWEIIRKRR